MLKQYLHHHKKQIFLCLPSLSTAAVVFALFHLPVAPVVYTGVVVCFFLFVGAALDFIKFRKQALLLCQQKKAITITDELLPKPEYVLEEEYQELLHILFTEKEHLSAKHTRQYEELADYYTIWAHQIKTPIAAMHLILQEMENGYQEPADETCKVPAIGELKMELQRIEQYVEMALCYLRLDAKTTDYVIREYDIDDILRQAIRKQAPVFIRKKLKLVYEPLCIRTVTDEKWLLFVIEQILSNALKYTASGSITISLCEPKTLCISDTGIGIAPEDLPRIFEKGFTGRNGRTSKQASGIGLYLCKRICTNLGHDLSITSIPGAGTEVYLNLENTDLTYE